jgi:hypothetical protein
MAAISLSSLDIRFSAAVKLPCDKGDGRTGRTLGRPLREWEEDVLADVTVDVTELMDGREVVVVEDDDDDDVFR